MIEEEIHKMVFRVVTGILATCKCTTLFLHNVEAEINDENNFYRERNVHSSLVLSYNVHDVQISRNICGLLMEEN